VRRARTGRTGPPGRALGPVRAGRRNDRAVAHRPVASGSDTGPGVPVTRRHPGAAAPVRPPCPARAGRTVAESRARGRLPTVADPDGTTLPWAPAARPTSAHRFT